MLEKAQYTSNVDSSCSDDENDQETIIAAPSNKKKGRSTVSTDETKQPKRKKT